MTYGNTEEYKKIPLLNDDVLGDFTNNQSTQVAAEKARKARDVRSTQTGEGLPPCIKRLMCYFVIGVIIIIAGAIFNVVYGDDEEEECNPMCPCDFAMIVSGYIQGAPYMVSARYSCTFSSFGYCCTNECGSITSQETQCTSK